MGHNEGCTLCHSVNIIYLYLKRVVVFRVQGPQTAASTPADALIFGLSVVNVGDVGTNTNICSVSRESHAQTIVQTRSVSVFIRVL